MKKVLFILLAAILCIEAMEKEERLIAAAAAKQAREEMVRESDRIKDELFRRSAGQALNGNAQSHRHSILHHLDEVQRYDPTWLEGFHG